MRLQCWALPQIGPLIRKSANCGLKNFGLQISEPISYRKHLRICGKKIEIYRKSANQPHHWDRFCNFQKKKFYHSKWAIDRFGGCIFKVQHPLTRFSCCGTIIFQNCYSWRRYSKFFQNSRPKSIILTNFLAGKSLRHIDLIDFWHHQQTGRWRNKISDLTVTVN